MALNLPLIAWGAPDDMTAAPYVNQAGTPTPTAGQADPFGGTAAVLYLDDDAAQIERRGFNYTNKTTGEVVFVEFVKQGSATGCGWIIRDTTAGGIDLVSCQLTWSTLTLSKTTGNGRMIGVIPVGGGWYAVIFTATGCVSGHLHQYMFACTLISAALTGTTYWYRRNAVLLDAPKDATAWESQREGSDEVRGPDGGGDTWITGWDQRFRGEFDRIPPSFRQSPAIVSGWDGLNEFTGIDCGVAAMLAAGRKNTSLIFVPDRSICTVSISSELVLPWQDPPTTDAIWDRRISLELKNPTTLYPLAA